LSAAFVSFYRSLTLVGAGVNER